jgi:hypothetical protein
MRGLPSRSERIVSMHSALDLRFDFDGPTVPGLGLPRNPFAMARGSRADRRHWTGDVFTWPSSLLPAPRHAGENRCHGFPIGRGATQFRRNGRVSVAAVIVFAPNENSTRQVNRISLHQLADRKVVISSQFSVSAISLSKL